MIETQGKAESIYRTKHILFRYHKVKKITVLERGGWEVDLTYLHLKNFFCFSVLRKNI